MGDGQEQYYIPQVESNFDVHQMMQGGTQGPSNSEEAQFKQPESEKSSSQSQAEVKRSAILPMLRQPTASKPSDGVTRPPPGMESQTTPTKLGSENSHAETQQTSLPGHYFEGSP